MLGSLKQSTSIKASALPTTTPNGLSMHYIATSNNLLQQKGTSNGFPQQQVRDIHPEDTVLNAAPLLNSSIESNIINTLIHELSSMKATSNSGGFDLFGDSNISTISNLSNVNLSNKKQPPPMSSLWACSPQSPSSSSSLLTQYHSASSHSNSKESLWGPSNQSSPTANNNLRETFYLANTSSNNSISSQVASNLWESPVAKMSQAVAITDSREAIGSIWQSPIPQAQSSPVSTSASIAGQLCNNSATIGKFGNLWASAKLVTKQPQQQDLIRSHDILSDLWCANGQIDSAANTNCCVPTNKKDSIGSLWGSSTMPMSTTLSTVDAFTNNNINAMNFKLSNDKISNNNTKSHSNINLGLREEEGVLVPTIPVSSATSSSCLALLSDEFTNYLNMIN